MDQRETFRNFLGDDTPLLETPAIFITMFGLKAAFFLANILEEQQKIGTPDTPDRWVIRKIAFWHDHLGLSPYLVHTITKQLHAYGLETRPDATFGTYQYHIDLTRLGACIQSFTPTPPYRKMPIPRSVHTTVFERDGYYCQQCGDRHNLTIDHIVPESKGGTQDLTNLQTLCRTCNARKGSRMLDSNT